MIHELRVSVTAAFLVAIPSILASAEPPKSKETVSSFKFFLDSKMEMDFEGEKTKLEPVTELRYSWHVKGGERTLQFEALMLKVKTNGKEESNKIMSRAKFVTIRQGKEEVLLFEKAAEPLQKILRDTFDVPICKIEVDADGKEIKRTMLAEPGSKILIDNGMIANALLFHPPYPKDKEEWHVDTEMSMGYNAFAKGKLNYKKIIGGKQGQAAKVTGTLTNDGFKVPDKPLNISQVRYVVDGEHTFDSEQREWISGQWTVDCSFRVTIDDKPIGTAKGKMVLTFERLPEKK